MEPRAPECLEVVKMGGRARPGGLGVLVLEGLRPALPQAAASVRSQAECAALGEGQRGLEAPPHSEASGGPQSSTCLRGEGPRAEKPSRCPMGDSRGGRVAQVHPAYHPPGSTGETEAQSSPGTSPKSQKPGADTRGNPRGPLPSQSSWEMQHLFVLQDFFSSLDGFASGERRELGEG